MTLIINDFFGSVLTKENVSTIFEFDIRIIISNISCHFVDIKVIDGDVTQKVNHLNSANAWDSTGFKHLKELKILIDPLIYIFNQSLFEVNFPKKFKLANIMPIFKRRDKQIADNYRPICLTLIVVKMLKSKC